MKKTFLILIIILSFGFNKKIESKACELTQEIKYVTAKSGLIYRNSPKGKRLGKFEFNDQLIITEHTNVFQEIQNGNEILKGEWVGTKVNKRTVYVFNGFLSDTKVKITLEVIKEFMGNKIWCSEEFRAILTETNSLAKAYNRSKIYTDIAYIKSDNIFLCDKQFMEPFPLEIDKFKIIEINKKRLTIQKESERYYFYKSNTEIHRVYKIGGRASASFEFFKKWFKGKYTLKIGDKTKEYSSEDISFFTWDKNDIIIANNNTYRVDKVIENTYLLSEIKSLEEEDALIIPTGKKAILRKIKDK